MITIIATSIFLHVTEGWALHLHEELIGMVFAGVLLGVGIGMILRVGGTTAGSAIIARIDSKRSRELYKRIKRNLVGGH